MKNLISGLVQKWLITPRQQLISVIRQQSWIRAVYGKLCTAFRLDEKDGRWSPRSSMILGFLPSSSTYIVHFLDSHLTWTQSVEVCSVFGRVRVHGSTLRPLKFYSIFNYRTNSPLTMERIQSPLLTTFDDVQSLINDRQLAESALLNVQQKGGDILLLRNVTDNNSLFLKMIRDQSNFSSWFCEKYRFFDSDDSWQAFERYLQIRLIESNDQTTVLPNEEFQKTASRIVERWKKESSDEFPFVVLICGEKDLGKSTLTRYLVNRALDQRTTDDSVTYFDCDLGQCEFTMGGCLSYVNVDNPLLGPPCSHIRTNPKPDQLLFYGLTSPQAAPVRYLQYVNYLRHQWNLDHQKKKTKHSLIFINTMGWGTGLGLELLKEIICMCCPNIVIQIASPNQSQNQMPEMTLPWLLEQPVFLPYRRSIEMKDRRQDDYDGQLNYEYIKLQSTASSPLPSNNNKSERRSLRPRDHRLLATWSYFFSSALHRIDLPWSQIVYLNQTNQSQSLPIILEHSIVALCSTDKFEQVRQSSSSINGLCTLVNYDEQCFDCFGFGWIERCDQKNETFQIYTPITDHTKVNLLVSGAFDAPEQFPSVFRSYSR